MTITLQNVSKRFGQITALDNVSLQLGGQKIYGLLGNNGAGKTTMLNIIASRRFADSGQVLLNGSPLTDSDRQLGAIHLQSHSQNYPESMKVKEALYWASLFYPDFDSAFAHQLVKDFKLPLKQKIVNLSTGYGAIFKIVIALSCKAPVLLLDEPVLGMDAQHRDMFYKLLLARYSQTPCTIVISTHLISEAANLIEHCIIIKDGKIIKDAPAEELLRQHTAAAGPAGLGQNALQDYFIQLMGEKEASL